jgi:hypothetical protein
MLANGRREVDAKAQRALTAYLGWVVCGVRNGGHHESDDDAAGCTKEDCDHDEASGAGNAQPDEDQDRGDVAGGRDDVVLPDPAGQEAAADSSDKRAYINKREEIVCKFVGHSVLNSVGRNVEIRSPESEDDHEQGSDLQTHVIRCQMQT